jgi:hypothetical protein
MSVMKKCLVIGFLVSSFSCFSNTGTAVGLVYDRGLGVGLDFNNIKITLGNDGMALDYAFKKGTFDPDTPLTWYISGGAYFDWDHGDEFGVRIPFGVNLYFAENWNLFTQAYPEVRLDDFHLSIGASIGVAYRF